MLFFALCMVEIEPKLGSVEWGVKKLTFEKCKNPF
jgi:hypothetical protein